MALTQVSRGLLSTSIDDNGNATAITIDSSENVGIGASPIALDGNATPGLTVSSNGPFILLQDANNSDKVRYISNNTGEFQFGIVGDNGTTGKTEHMRIDASGNFLVGTSTAHLTSSTFSGYTQFAGGHSIQKRSGGIVAYFDRLTDDGTIMQFRHDGAAIGGIATISDDLTIFSSTASHVGLRFGNTRLQPTDNAGATTDGVSDLGFSNSRFKDLHLSGKLFINNDIQMNQQNGRFDYDGGSSGGAIRFFSTSANTERARLTSAGAFILNTTGIPNGNQDAIYLDASGGDRFSSRNNTSARHHLVFKNPNGEVGRIETSGTSTSYVTSSDHRLKENVVVMSGATERLKQLNPSRFNFIADADTTVDGFLAHEVADVVPEAISGTKDAVDSEGNPVYQGIDQSKLVPLLVATIQELEARITQLENN